MNITIKIATDSREEAESKAGEIDKMSVFAYLEETIKKTKGTMPPTSAAIVEIR